MKIDFKTIVIVVAVLVLIQALVSQSAIQEIMYGFGIGENPDSPAGDTLTTFQTDATQGATSGEYTPEQVASLRNAGRQLRRYSYDRPTPTPQPTVRPTYLPGPVPAGW